MVVSKRYLNKMKISAGDERFKAIEHGFEEFAAGM
jgi:hypothetical protein